MKELEVWEHQAGWGFVGITTGIIFGLLCILILHLAQDPRVFTSWSGALRAIWLELVLAVILGWFIGATSAWIFYSSTNQRSPAIFRRNAGGIARLSFILIFSIMSIYYFFSIGPNQNTYPAIFWLTGVLGLFISGRMGSIVASLLLMGMED